MKETEVKIGQRKYVIKKFTFGEANEIIDLSTSIDERTFMPVTKASLFRLYNIVKGAKLVEKDKSRMLTREEVEAMDESEGVQLFNAIRRFNQVPLSSYRGL